MPPSKGLAEGDHATSTRAGDRHNARGSRDTRGTSSLSPCKERSAGDELLRTRG